MKETTPVAMPPCFHRWCGRFDNCFKSEAQKNGFRQYLGFAAKSLLVGLGVSESGVSESVAGRFRLCCPLFSYQFVYYKKDNARFLRVPIRFSQHEHRILTGQKPYCKRVLPLFSKPQLGIEKNARL